MDDFVEPPEVERIRLRRVDLLEHLADLERARIRLQHLLDQIDADTEATRVLLARSTPNPPT